VQNRAASWYDWKLVSWLIPRNPSAFKVPPFVHKDTEMGLHGTRLSQKENRQSHVRRLRLSEPVLKRNANSQLTLSEEHRPHLCFLTTLHSRRSLSHFLTPSLTICIPLFTSCLPFPPPHLSVFGFQVSSQCIHASACNLRVSSPPISPSPCGGYNTR
jgi:hypothetical protein